MFIDCWPSITWSVVDYYGKKKSGYYTLKKAYQPLYVSLGIRQKKYSLADIQKGNKKLNIDFWVINDYQKEFNNCRLIFNLNEKTISKININNISADSITHFSWEQNEIILPRTLKAGKYKIIVELYYGNKNISVNDFEIEIVKV